MQPERMASGIFIIPNGTIVFEFVALFLLLFLLRRYVVPRLQLAMEERQEAIRKSIEEAREAKERLEKAEADYKEALADARTEAANLREEARSEGKRIIEEMRVRAQEEAANISVAHQRQMEIDRQRTVAELRSELGQLAVDLAGRIVGESLQDEARRSGTVDRFLAELEN
jgi:F-type H+-transporting ATPase subunit b